MEIGDSLKIHNVLDSLMIYLAKTQMVKIIPLVSMREAQGFIPRTEKKNNNISSYECEGAGL